MNLSTPGIGKLANLAQRHSDMKNNLDQMVERARVLFAANPRARLWRQISEAAVTAAVRGDLDAIRSFVAAGIAPDEVLAPRHWPTTLLHSATYAKEVNVLVFLVGLNPNLDVLDGLGRPPLQLIFDSSPARIEQARVLVRAGASLDIPKEQRGALYPTAERAKILESLRPLRREPVTRTRQGADGVWRANGLSAEFRLVRRHASTPGLFRVATVAGEHWAPGDELTWATS